MVSGITWWPEVTTGTSFNSGVLLAISRPTKLSRYPMAAINSAAPFASATIRTSVNFSTGVTEMLVTSLWVITVCDLSGL